jgi:hypothetical protein
VVVLVERVSSLWAVFARLPIHHHGTVPPIVSASRPSFCRACARQEDTQSLGGPLPDRAALIRFQEARWQ